MNPLTVLQILVALLTYSPASVEAKVRNMIQVFFRSIISLFFLYLRRLLQRNYIMQFDVFDCSQNEDLVESNCSISSKVKKPIINMNFVPKRDLDSIFFNGTIYRGEIDDQLKFLNFEKINVCEFLEHKYSSITIVSIFRDMFSRYTNFPNCPFKKGKLYFIKGMKFDPEKFPPIMMDIKLVSKSVLFTGENVKIAAANISASGRNKKGKAGQ